MMRATVAVFTALARPATKSNPDEKPVYFVRPTADAA